MEPIRPMNRVTKRTTSRLGTECLDGLPIADTDKVFIVGQINDITAVVCPPGLIGNILSLVRFTAAAVSEVTQ